LLTRLLLKPFTKLNPKTAKNAKTANMQNRLSTISWRPRRSWRLISLDSFS
jgi:hypothetical protein